MRRRPHHRPPRHLAVLGFVPVVVVVLAVTGCTSKGAGTPSAAGTESAAAAAAGTSASPDPSALASSVAVTADTKRVCSAINDAIAEGSKAFGADLGSFAGHLAGGNKAEADKARTDAVAQLKTLATKIRTLGAQAQDERVRSAAQMASDQITALAADPALTSGVKSASDLGPVIEKLTRATDAMNSVCI